MALLTADYLKRFDYSVPAHTEAKDLLENVMGKDTKALYDKIRKSIVVDSFEGRHQGKLSDAMMGVEMHDLNKGLDELLAEVGAKTSGGVSSQVKGDAKKAFRITEQTAADLKKLQNLLTRDLKEMAQHTQTAIKDAQKEMKTFLSTETSSIGANIGTTFETTAFKIGEKDVYFGSASQVSSWAAAGPNDVYIAIKDGATKQEAIAEIQKGLTQEISEFGKLRKEYIRDAGQTIIDHMGEYKDYVKEVQETVKEATGIIGKNGLTEAGEKEAEAALSKFESKGANAAEGAVEKAAGKSKLLPGLMTAAGVGLTLHGLSDDENKFNLRTIGGVVLTAVGLGGLMKGRAAQNMMGQLPNAVSHVHGL